MRRNFAPLLALLLFAFCAFAGAQTPSLVKPQPNPSPDPAHAPRPLSGPSAAQPTPTPTPQPAQTRDPAHTPQTIPGLSAAVVPAANPADVDTLDHIIAALYDVISGPATKPRNWDRLRSLFVTGARMIPTVPLRPAGTAPDTPLTGSEAYAPRVLTVEDYVARAGPLMSREGFYERESARRAEQFGHIAHVFSTYESRHAAEDAKPFQRGINSIQLVFDGKRWWIVTIMWEGETPVTPLPEKYLKGTP